MVKFINILVVATLFFGCRKDKVAPLVFLGEEYSFLAEEWQWSQSIICWSVSGFASYSGQKYFVHDDDIAQYCNLHFAENGILTIATLDGTQKKQLRPYGLVEIGENRIAHFQTDNGDIVTFSWSKNLNRLETEYTFFTFPAHACNTGFLILSNSYERN